MTKKNELSYYCLFDPTTGDRLGSYIEGITKVPENAIKVSKNDFLVYASSPNWKYDWETNEPKYVYPAAEVITIEDLRKKALTKASDDTAKAITSGFVLKLKAAIVRLDSDITDQLNYNTYAAAANNNPEYTCVVRGVISGDYGKTEFKLTAPEIISVQQSCAKHIDDFRKAGWERQAWINDIKRTEKELQDYLGGDN